MNTNINDHDINDHDINDHDISDSDDCSDDYSSSSSSSYNETSSSMRHIHILNELENRLDYALQYANAEDNDDDDDEFTVSTHISTYMEDVSWLDNMDESDLDDFREFICDHVNDYIESELDNIYMASFEDTLIKNVSLLAANQLKDAGILVDEDDLILEEFIYHVYSEICASNSHLVPRSRPTVCPTSLDESYKTMIDSILDAIKNNEGQKYKQRTYEWYMYRAGLITASNIWKIFSGSQASQNSLIYEKCKPFSGFTPKIKVEKDGGDEDATEVCETQEKAGHVNTGTAFHWGNKYEPLSIQIYEKKYNTKVAEFGCIRHEKYPFIGASPDGINVCRDSPRYGRMIEVKNIYNREITGIPKDEYWIQMQFQMETCGLAECDFIETRFEEYENEAQFYANEFTHDTRGVILYFVERNINSSLQTHVENINPYYVYMPIDHSLEKECVDDWIREMKENYKHTHHLYEVIYWYLDEFSCVLVDINKLWLNHVIPKVEAFWDVICREKVSGYEHRSAKKKAPKEDTGAGKICLIKLDADGNPI